MKIRLYKTILGRTVQKLAKKGFFARDFRCNSIFLVAKQMANLQKHKNKKHSNHGSICGPIVWCDEIYSKKMVWKNYQN